MDQEMAAVHWLARGRPRLTRNRPIRESVGLAGAWLSTRNFGLRVKLNPVRDRLCPLQAADGTDNMAAKEYRAGRFFHEVVVGRAARHCSRIDHIGCCHHTGAR